MNTKTMEGLVGVKTNMEMVNTPFRVYKQARLGGGRYEDNGTAMGYVKEHKDSLEKRPKCGSECISFRTRADSGIKCRAEGNGGRKKFNANFIVKISVFLYN